jgi:hypothetical protein
LIPNQLKSAKAGVPMSSREVRRLSPENAAQAEKLRMDRTAIGVLDLSAGRFNRDSLLKTRPAATSIKSRTHVAPLQQSRRQRIEPRRRFDPFLFL